MQISKVQFRNNPIDSSFYNKQQISKTRIMTLPQDSFVLQKTVNPEPAKINFKANSPVSNIIAQMLKSMAYKRSIKGSKRPYSTLYKELKDITPKEKLITEQPKISAAKISEVEPPAQAKKTEKIETKKYVPADETPSNKTNSEEPQKLSRKERLLAIKNSEDKIIDVQKDQEKFIWTPSIKK